LIRRILAEHPGLALLLVGDTGQLDPEIYAAAAREHPGRIRAIYVRRTGAVNAHRAAEVDALAAATTAAGVPMLAVDDSVEIAEHAASLGLLDAEQVDDVRHETHLDGLSRVPWPVDVVRPRTRAARRGAPVGEGASSRPPSA
jgi:phosphatidate phosphatase APP1